MQLRDLNDAFHWIRQLKKLVDRIYSGALLENSSISDGRMRFIGGQLLIDSGGRLDVVGTFDGTGNFTWSGPWRFDSGDGEIAGSVDMTGNMTVKGGGKVRVEGGDSPATLEDGKLTFDTGGELQADVANGGARLRSGDAVVNVGNVASIRNGDTSVIVGPLGITVNAPSGQQILLQGSVSLSGLATAPSGVATVPLVYAPSTGRVYRGS